VVEERCIGCGTCIRECPQQAKAYRSDLDVLRERMAQGTQAVVSIAPAFAAVFTEGERLRLPSALRLLGFCCVSETSVGAWPVAQESARLFAARSRGPAICTACPAVVSYIEHYHPDKIDCLLPVKSPMAAHGSMLKKRYPGALTVFVGPCVAKKQEGDQGDVDIDVVLTFEELRQWLEDEHISLALLEESPFDELPRGRARYFPLPGGLAATADMDCNPGSGSVITTSGVEELEDLLSDEVCDGPPVLVEALFCRNGCIDGPAAACSDPLVLRRRRVEACAEALPEDSVEDDMATPDLARSFGPHVTGAQEFPEEDIRRVLAEMGKPQREDELDCGSCGYPDCRSKAIAVLNGMAEPSMCIPHMRRLAEQRTDRIIESSPNGIVILDHHLKILHMNPAFRQFFAASDVMLGKPVSQLMDPEAFERLAAQQTDHIEGTLKHPGGKVFRQLLYVLPADQQYVGIFINTTQHIQDKRKLEDLRFSTIEHAQELLEHQMSFAHDMARMLGEQSARGEELLNNLMKMMDTQQQGQATPWDTSTLK